MSVHETIHTPTYSPANGIYELLSDQTKVIAGRNLGNLNIEGEITINGLPAGTAMTKISAYVQQDDIFIGSMTVYEHLVFQAALRMSKETKDFRMKRVQEVMKGLFVFNTDKLTDFIMILSSRSLLNVRETT